MGNMENVNGGAVQVGKDKRGDHRQGHRSMNEYWRRFPVAYPSDPPYIGTDGVGLVGLRAI